MRDLVDAILASVVPGVGVALLVDVALKATLLVLGGAALAVALRRSAASLRHFVWSLTVAGLVALPLAVGLLPAWNVPVPPRFVPTPSFDAAAVAERPAVPTIAPSPAVATQTAPRGAGANAGLDATPVDPSTEGQQFRLGIGWTAWIVPVWLSGVALVLAGIGIGLARLRWIARAARPLTDPAWRGLLTQSSREIGLSRPVTLLRSPGPAMPMTWGIRRPVVLLPADADRWPADRRRGVLLHELAHVRRHDVLTQLVARLACAVYWFHPLVWIAAAQLRVERERACDDQVLCAGARASEYAGHLLELARSLRVAPATSLASVAMARRSQLATRLLDVLDAGRRRDGVSPGTMVPAWLTLAAIVLPLAAASPAPTAAPAPVVSMQEAGSGQEPTFLPSYSPPLLAERGPTQVAVMRPALVVLSADTLRECGGDRVKRSSSSSTHEDGGVPRTSIRTLIGQCEVLFRAEGKFTFTDDFTDIATVASGGEVMVEVDYGTRTRRLEIRRGGGPGGLEREYTVDRAVRPYDAEARAWLTETLTFLLRRSGLYAEERAQWILERRGITGLIDEIAFLQSDYARRQYYQAAVASGKLDPAGFERLVTKAGQEIESDYELAELLIKVAGQQPLTAGMQAGFVAAARTIDSDYERRRVLDVALGRPGLTTEVAAGMLAAAGEIDSDYELAELLIKLQRARPINDGLRPAYFAAVNTIQSDYEHRRVLTALLDQRELTGAVLAATLESARAIRSDFELAELLIGVARDHPLTPELRVPFFAALDGVGSDYEHRRVLGLVVGQEGLDKGVVLDVLKSARAIRSDFELAELLVAVARRYRIDASLRPAFEEAANTIGSGYENDRVMAALARSQGRSPELQ